MNHVLEFDGIRLRFGDRTILSDIYMKCETGQVTGVLGRNGQGKTSLFRIVYGEMNVEDVSVRFDKERVKRAYKRPDLIRFLPQFNFVPGHLTIAGVFAAFEVDHKTFQQRFPVYKSMADVRLRNLSGGQFRFVQTYLILKSASKFVILDEPFTHLMPLQIEEVIELITEEAPRKGVLITDHLYRHVVDISDRLYVLSNGKTHLVEDIHDIADLGYI